MNVDNIYTIIFLVIAIVIFLRLRSVLGRRTGNERPPFDPFSRREAPRSAAGGEDKVVSLPRRPVRARGRETRSRDRGDRPEDPDARTRRLDARTRASRPSPPPTAASIRTPSSPGRGRPTR